MRWLLTDLEAALTRSFRCYACVVALCYAAAAGARPPVERPDNLLDDRFEIGGTFVFSSSDTSLRVDSSAGAPGTTLNGESDLALPHKKLIGELDVMFRPAERHTVRVNYLFLPLSRDATTALKQPINFKDSSYSTGDVVSSQLDIKLEGLTYTYSFIKNDRVELGAGLGVDLIEVSAQANVPARLAEQHQETSAPVPLGTIDATYRFSSRWYAQGDWQYMRATVNHIYGSVATWQLGALYRVNPNVTLGVGFQSYHVTVDSRKVGDTGLFTIKTTGPMISARVGF